MILNPSSLYYCILGHTLHTQGTRIRDARARSTHISNASTWGQYVPILLRRIHDLAQKATYSHGSHSFSRTWCSSQAFPAASSNTSILHAMLCPCCWTELLVWRSASCNLLIFVSYHAQHVSRHDHNMMRLHMITSIIIHGLYMYVHVYRYINAYIYIHT